jgi:exosome complex RNA-binding protein Csl4
MLLAAACNCNPPVTVVPDAGPFPGDPCMPNPCRDAHRGVCQAAMGIAECRCDPGYTEAAGQCTAATTCEPNTCGGHGTCSIGSAGPQCACTLGWAGSFCQSCDAANGYYDDGHGHCTLDACEPNPCTADPTRALCTVVNHAAVCQCNAGTHDAGGTCVADTACTPTSCAGHGTCAVQGTAIACSCDSGWAGAACNQCDSVNGFHSDGAGGCTQNACLPSPCTEPHRSVCVNQGGITHCDCDTGYHFDGTACVVDDVCMPSTCGAHGTCAVMNGVARCMCDPAWSGSACELCAQGYHSDGAGGCTMDVCLPNPCTSPNRTTCVAMGSTPTCQCDPGTHEDGTGGCTNDPCLPNPCAAMNQACRAMGTGYQCYVPPCDDMNPCTDDSVVGGSCVHAARMDGAACSTDICTVGQTCQAGVCKGGGPRACDDGNPCTRDTCVSPAGCTSTNDDTLVPPDDGIACTVEVCSAGASQHTPSNARCDDGLYCDGTEVCMPGAGADSRGCQTTNVPMPPGPSTPCAKYVCNETTDSFTLMTSSTGSSCDDGIACTSGDVCDASGMCAGTVSASCGPPSGTCTSTTALPATLDIGLAPVTGTITMNGGLLPLVTNNYENGVIWARATDTGKLHRLRLIDWTNSGSYPSYSRSASSNTINTTLIPGVYDILYQRAYQSSGDYVEERTLSPGPDPVVNGYRLLMSAVVIPAGGRTLNVDIAVTTVTGTITQNGAMLPLTTDNYENGVIWARATDTGKLHRLRLIDWTNSGSYPSYSRSAASNTINTTLMPGTYDILYQRAYQTSADYVEERTLSPTPDPVINGYRVLQTGVVVSGAAQTINVDIASTTITGTITMNGAALPLTTDNYENGVIWARASDTGKLHRLRLIDWTNSGSYPTYTRSAGSDTINTTLMPGTYDLLYQRAYQTSADYVEERTLSPSADPVVNGFRVLRTGVAVSGAAQTINVDIPFTTITGTITQNGAALPLTTDNYENGVIWARATDTGKLHRLRLIDWTNSGSYPSYTRSAGSDTLNTTLMPGTYDLLYQRAYQSSGDYVEEQTLSPSADPVVNGFRVLRAGVVVSGATQTINVDIPFTTVTGTITQNGATLPLTTDNYENGVIWARASDTGKLHRLRLIDWTNSGSYPSYTRSAGSNTINTTLMPGTYDILYQRAYQSSGDYVEERTLSPSPDPVVNGYRVLQTGVVVAGAAQALNVDIPAVSVSGAITMGGAPLPMVTDNYENGVIWARARDTGKLHRMRLIDWTNSGSYPSYTRSAASNTINTTLMPGTYDILYQRAYETSGDYVEERTLSPSPDPVVNGFRILNQCVLIQ